MRNDDIRFDIGTPENYLESLVLSYSFPNECDSGGQKLI
jgi:hypothetical protein